MVKKLPQIMGSNKWWGGSINVYWINKEPVLNNQWADELCLQISDDYGYAEIVWYALNGKRVVEGNYGDPKLVGIDEDVRL